MSVRPILFNSKMVKAILEGRKTQARMIVNATGFENMRFAGMQGRFALFEICDDGSGGHIPFPVLRSKYEIGDVLYVKETWKQVTGGNAGAWLLDAFLYKADEPHDTTWLMIEDRWHPSVHMPKKAARIWVKVTDIKVQKLNDMTIDDVLHEGASIVNGFDDFKKIWDSTVRKDLFDEQCWKANPYVWVIMFERIEKPCLSIS